MFSFYPIWAGKDLLGCRTYTGNILGLARLVAAGEAYAAVVNADKVLTDALQCGPAGGIPAPVPGEPAPAET